MERKFQGEEKIHEEIRKQFSDQFDDLPHLVGSIVELVSFIYFLESKPKLDEDQEIKKKKYLNKLKAILFRVLKEISCELVPDS